jgi:hypothetical protein
VLATGDTDFQAGTSAPTVQTVQFRYDAATNSYQIALPNFEPGTLVNTFYNGTGGEVADWSVSRVSAGSSTTVQPAYVTLPVPGSTHSPDTYTSYGFWGSTDGLDPPQEGVFAYGIPTANGDMPITGNATYSADIHAIASSIPGFDINGTASLQFDFAAGTLSGFMHPELVDDFDGFYVDFGQYDFTQTVYSSGSTTFSGSFIVPGMPSAESSFTGNFTGPHGSELMANFVAPYSIQGSQGTLGGIWVGRRP